MCQHYSSNASVNPREKIISVCNKCDQLESFWKIEQVLSNTERRFEMSAKKLALDNHGQMITKLCLWLLPSTDRTRLLPLCKRWYRKENPQGNW